MAVVVTLVACDAALGQVIVVARHILNCSCCCRGTVMLGLVGPGSFEAILR